MSERWEELIDEADRNVSPYAKDPVTVELAKRAAALEEEQDRILARIKVGEWESGLCSRHQVADPMCRTCNHKIGDVYDERDKAIREAADLKRLLDHEMMDTEGTEFDLRGDLKRMAEAAGLDTNYSVCADDVIGKIAAKDATIVRLKSSMLLFATEMEYSAAVNGPVYAGFLRGRIAAALKEESDG